MESHRSLVVEKLNTIKSFLDAKQDLMEDGHAEEEATRTERRKPKPVIATELNTNNIKEYKSMHASQKGPRG